MAFDAQWHNMLDQMKSDQTSKDLSQVELASHFRRMKFSAVEMDVEDRANILGDVGTWAGLDNAGLEKHGIGLFFEKCADGAVVISIVPGCSAHRTGVIRMGDILLAVNQKPVKEWTIAFIREQIQGKPGSFVIIDMMRPEDEEQPEVRFRLNIMRGSPEFVDNTSKFGPPAAHKLNLLWDKLKAVERHYFRLNEKEQVEQAKFEEARDRKAESLQNEKRLEADLETLKRALAHEERRLQVLEQRHKTLEEGLYVDDAEPAGYFVC